MDRSALIDYLRIHLVAGVGPVRFRKLLDAFGAPSRIAAASASELRSAGIGQATADQIVEGLRIVEPERELDLADRAGARIVTWEDDAYPALLRQSPTPPALLYVKGELRHGDQLALAIVGTRKPSRYGAEQSYRFASLLAGAGFTVVSGLARGIDIQAHRGAMHAGGRTVAVLGAGLNRVYPPEHLKEVERIADGHGAVVTELPMEWEPDARNFPARNRIVAAMTLGTLVVEAPKKSGALITARYATDFSREVFAIPGPIDHPGFVGSHDRLKRGGAKLVTDLNDILDELGHAGEIMKDQVQQDGAAVEPLFATVAEAQLDTLTGDERKVYDFLEQACDLDTICQLCQLDASVASSAVTMLQLKGMVKPLPGNQFCRR